MSYCLNDKISTNLIIASNLYPRKSIWESLETKDH